MTDMEKVISRAKALEHVRRVLDEVKIKIAWADQALDFEFHTLEGANRCLELAEMQLSVELKMLLAAHKLTVGPGNDQEPVSVALAAAQDGASVLVAFA